jgi:UDP-N-acetylglucosamine acyltransferase
LNTKTSTSIHPTAIIEDGATMGAGCVIHPYAVIRRHCELGEGVVVHPFAVVGADPQDLSFDVQTRSGVRIGARTVIREHATISRATKPGTFTSVGEDCFLMTGCHVAHDCRVGDRVVIANAVLLAGHVQIGDRAFLGGGAVIHQFCRIGESVMVGGGARISLDVAPFSMVTERNAVVGLNRVGLRRRGLPRETLDEIKRAFGILRTGAGNLRDIAATSLQRDSFQSSEARIFLEFFKDGRRGFARLRRDARIGDAAAGAEA